MSELRQEKQVTTAVVIGYKCDVCGKLSDGLNREGWHDFSSQHFDWGNDSGDSYQKHDVCSVACYLEQAITLLNHWGEEYKSLEIDGFDRTFISGLVAQTEVEATS